MDMLVTGLIPEIIYYVTWIFLIKNFKEKRILFTTIMILQYFILLFVFYYDLKFQFLFLFGTYITMKFIYKEKVQITDLFIFMYSIIILMISSYIGLFIMQMFDLNMTTGAIISRVLMFSYILLRYKVVRAKYEIYYNNWNIKPTNKFKSLTVRNFSLLMLYIVLLIINTRL